MHCALLTLGTLIAVSAALPVGSDLPDSASLQPRSLHDFVLPLLSRTQRARASRYLGRRQGTIEGSYGDGANSSSPWKGIIVFGDSLSDNGNGSWALTDREVPAPNEYWHGRWSNGPTWVEYMADALNVSLNNFAYGGATTSNEFIPSYENLTNGTQVLIPSVNDQVSIFSQSPISALATGNASYLYILEIGANDYLRAFANGSLTEALPGNVVDDIKKNIEKIVTVARPVDLVVVNLPPIDSTPFIQSQGPISRIALSATASAIVELHNRELLDVTGTLNATNTTNATTAINATGAATNLVNATSTRLWYLDAFEAFQTLNANASKYGFGNVSGACLVGPSQNCSTTANESSYFFWDDVHPTTRVHQILGDSAAQWALSSFSKSIKEFVNSYSPARSD